MGNSEVGHLISAPAASYNHWTSTRIDLLIANSNCKRGRFFQQAMERARQRRLHLMGLLSDGACTRTSIICSHAGNGQAEKSRERLITASWMAGILRRTAAAISCSDSAEDSGTGWSVRLPRWSGATTPWIATIGGSARTRLSRVVQGERKRAPRPLAALQPATSKMSPTNS